MKAITTEEMKRIEKLAMLRLPAEKREEMAAALQRLLEYAETLDALDTEGVEPAVHLFTGENVLREDEPGEAFGVENTMSNAPEKENRYFVVPGTIAGKE